MYFVLYPALYPIYVKKKQSELLGYHFQLDVL